MKIQEFNAIYKNAQKVNVSTDPWFNSMGWFWINLTDNQLTKMYNLMLTQGATETVQNGRKCIQLERGFSILNPQDKEK